jgi:hypothetical protein
MSWNAYFRHLTQAMLAPSSRSSYLLIILNQFIHMKKK